MAMVFVFPFMTVVMARNNVVNASARPITNIIAPIISLDRSFMLKDICIMEEKQNEAKMMKNVSTFLLLKVVLFSSSVKEHPAE